MKTWAFKILAVLGVLVTAIGLRVYAAQTIYIDYDEPVYLTTALQYANYVRNGQYTWLAWSTANLEHPVFYKLVYGAVLLGQEPLQQLNKKDFPSGGAIQAVDGRPWGMADRYASVAFGSLAVLALALLNPLAGLFLAVDSLAVRYTSGVYLEALPLLTSLLSALAYLAWFDRYRQGARGRTWMWLGLSAFFLGMTAASKYIYAVVGLAIGLHFCVAVVLKKARPSGLKSLFLWGGAALLVFFLLDPYLWPHPVNRLLQSLAANQSFSQSENATRYGYAFWQPLVWLSAPYTTYTPAARPSLPVRVDLFISLLGLVGLPRLFKKQPFYVLWLAVALGTLFLWPTKWPQYVLILLVPYCLCAAEGARWLFDLLVRWLRRSLQRAPAV